MIQEIYILVETACTKETNHFGYDVWTHHILSVVKYSKILAQKQNADEEIVVLAALLHDYAGILNYKYYDDHHIHSSRLAKEILQKYSYPKNKIKIVQNCILTHRGSKNYSRKSKEAKILASADALAHFDNINSLLHLAFVHHKKSPDEGIIWVLKKLENSWKKLMPEGKKIIKNKYNCIKKSFKPL